MLITQIAATRLYEMADTAPKSHCVRHFVQSGCCYLSDEHLKLLCELREVALYHAICSRAVFRFSSKQLRVLPRNCVATSVGETLLNIMSIFDTCIVCVYYNNAAISETA